MRDLHSALPLDLNSNSNKTFYINFNTFTSLTQYRSSLGDFFQLYFQGQHQVFKARGPRASGRKSQKGIGWSVLFPLGMRSGEGLCPKRPLHFCLFWKALSATDSTCYHEANVTWYFDIYIFQILQKKLAFNWIAGLELRLCEVR